MLSRKTHITALICTLLLVSASLFCYRYFYLGVPLAPQKEIKSWTVEANLKFLPLSDKPIKASFKIPNLPPFYATLDEYFVSNNYGVTTNVLGNNRETVWSKRRATDLQSVYYRAIFRHTKQSDLPLKKNLIKPLTTPTGSEASAIKAIANEARKASADIETFAQATIKLLKNGGSNTHILLGNENSNEAIVKAAQKVLSEANIVAVSVKGLHLGSYKKASLDTWLSVYNDKQWIFINPITGGKEYPENFLIWQYGDEPLFKVSGGKKPFFNLTVTPTSVSALSLAKIRGTKNESRLIKFSLLQLPLSLQQTYQILLTVPVGAFIILLLRNFVGLVTFGTFMPVLVALAFRETHLLWGIVLFTTIVSFGLLARFYLDQLRLLVVPRLACILTIVIFLMIFISILSQHLGIETGLSVALFPMIILTMVIERMCIIWDERGALEAVKTGAGSLLAASITFTVMNNQQIQYLVFAFPELLLGLMALILLCGQYRGYRMFELLRFRALQD
jgi:hypothetical protein